MMTYFLPTPGLKTGIYFWTDTRLKRGCGKQHFCVWNTVKIWRTGWHIPTKNSQEYPPGVLTTPKRQILATLRVKHKSQFPPCFQIKVTGHS